MSTFDELLSGTVLKTAKRLYKAPTDVQKRVIPIVLAHHDVVAMSKTGSGKTAAFLFPMIQILGEHSKITGCRGLVLSPTRELSLQTANFFRQYSAETGLRSASLIGGEPLPPQFDALTQNPDVIIATPGRLLHIIAETRYSLSRVQYLVIDEADRMFEEGLENELQAILQLLPDTKQVLLFSATIPQLLADFSQVNLKHAILERCDTTELPDTLRIRFKYVRPPFKTALLLNVITGYKNSMVFVGTRHCAEYLSAIMTEMGIRSACIYGTMDQDERSSSLAQFARGAIKVLIVTDVAARGIDVEGLDLVVNYDFPDRPKIFLHRSGRAGRAGRKGEVVSFVTHDEIPYFCGTKEALKGSDGWFLQKVSQEEVQDEIDRVNDAIKRSSDIEHLLKGKEDSEKMYIKSRKPAKHMWLALAKELNIDAGTTMEDKVLAWRPQKTIFEQVSATSKQLQAAMMIREAHKGHLKSELLKKEEEAAPEPVVEQDATESTEAPVEAEKPKMSNRRKRMLANPPPPKKILEEKDYRSKFFLNPLQDGHDATAIRENMSNISSYTMDLTPEDNQQRQLQKAMRQKNKKAKDLKAIKNMMNGQAFLRSAVEQLEGVTPHGEKYRQWMEQSHKHIQDAGQDEKQFSTKKPKGGYGKVPKTSVKSEIKTPEQIERDRLIKLKHKLNDQGKHREAAQLNAKIYGGKKGKRR